MNERVLPSAETAARSAIRSIYVLGFFFTLHVTVSVFVNSTFLSSFVGEKFVGAIYTIGSLATIAAFAFLPRIIKKRGDYRVTLGLLGLEFVALILLAAAEAPALLIAAFVTHFTVVTLIGFNLDIILEAYSTDTTTGGVRGLYYSIMNAAWIAGPLIAGRLVMNGDYAPLYLGAAFLLLPAILLFERRFRGFRDPNYRRMPFAEMLASAVLNRDIRRIFAVGFLLQFFFAWMVIYLPIYLHEYVGFSWGEIGILFSIMLLPFILLEAPLGYLADKRFGEKEMLIIGLAVMGAATLFIPFLKEASVVAWAALLFATRVGASTVEIMSETYFFKSIASGDVEVLGMYRVLRPLAYLAGPLFASTILIFLPLQHLFLVLGLIMLGGILAVGHLTDKDPAPANIPAPLAQ